MPIREILKARVQECPCGASYNLAFYKPCPLCGKEAGVQPFTKREQIINHVAERLEVFAVTRSYAESVRMEHAERIVSAVVSMLFSELVDEALKVGHAADDLLKAVKQIQEAK